MRKGEFDAILVWKVDRISRKNRDVLDLLDNELHPRNMKLLVSTCDIDSSNANGYMFISMLGTFAEYERSLIIERVSSGMEKRAKSGMWNGGIILGYDVVDKGLLINQEESEIVKQIFQLRANGLGYKAIVHTLNAEGKKTKKNNEFSTNAVKTILENKTYIGDINWGNHREWEKKRRSGKTDPINAEGIHDSIINLELWNRTREVHRINRDASTNTKNIKSDFILTGILRCPSCGAGMVMNKSKKRDGSGYYFYYMCQNYHTKGKEVCLSNLVKKEVVEEKVLNYINGLLTKTDIVNDILDKISNDKHTNTDKLQEQIRAYNKELSVKQKELDTIDKDYRNNDISAQSYGRLSKKIEVEVERLQEIINGLDMKYDKINSAYSIDERIVREALENFSELFIGASNENKKILIKSLIKKIEMEPNRKEIKSIVFWFLEDNALSLKSALPINEGRRTVS